MLRTVGMVLSNIQFKIARGDRYQCLHSLSRLGSWAHRHSGDPWALWYALRDTAALESCSLV